MKTYMKLIIFIFFSATVLWLLLTSSWFKNKEISNKKDRVEWRAKSVLDHQKTIDNKWFVTTDPATGKIFSCWLFVGFNDNSSSIFCFEQK